MAKLLLGSVVGPQGPQGTPGVNGSQGPQGIPGPNEVTATTDVVGLTSGQLLYNNGGKVGSVEIVDNLLSVNPNEPLSANQGKVLKSLIDGNSLAIGQVASDLNTHKAEKVHQYEEGTFTPLITNVGVVHSLQQGYYTKIGNLVTIVAKIETTTKSTAEGTDLLTVAGLPFMPSAKSTGKSIFNIKVANMTTALGVIIGYFVEPTFFVMSKLDNNISNLYSGIRVADTTATTQIWITGQYYI